MTLATKRSLLALALLTFVTACTNVTSLSRAEAEDDALKLNKVIVDASQLKVVSEGRTITKTRAQLEQDLAAAITTEALKLSDPDGLPANVNVTVNKVYLAPLVGRVVAETSYIESTISVTDAADGDTIIAPVEVVGNSDTLRAVGTLAVVGALANADIETDYQNAVRGYAKSLMASLVASAEEQATAQ